MPDVTIKIRVESADLAVWRQVSGYRGLSQWLRGLANAEILRLEADSARFVRENQPVAPPARVLAPAGDALVNAAALLTCRHGLVNCRVCSCGAFAPE